MTTETTDTVEHTTTSSNPTGVARCEALEDQSEPYTVHGVAIGANEVTFGSNGPKFWPDTALEASVQSLVGVPLNKNHDDKTVESVVGEVIDAGFEPGVGIVFEAEIDDEELATKVARGRLEVSVHALHGDGGRTSEGEVIVEDVRFLDLSLVPRGGSPSNYVEAGEHPSEVLASLSESDVDAILATSGSDSTTTMTDENTDDIEPDDEESEMESRSPGSSPGEEAEEAEVEADTESEDTEEAEVEADNESGDTEEAEVEADDESDDTEEAELQGDELRDEVATLRSQNQELRNELESVRLEYASQLSEDTAFEAEMLAEKFSFDELRETFDEAEASLVTSNDDTSEATPAPQTGGDGDAELSTGGESESDAEIAELESQIESYDSMGWDAAKRDAEQRLDELQA
ncbi:hypothetical protein [Halorubrum sp. AJ67]|uniref:hypothetical protein n=1 Tax=Halorubrum sp. AJ67 TaxID=1173487 RepID=UPI0003DD56C9|nr:hypothetical protein [Halorubrum sp. AJ67]CDK39667.1 hypothetical protein BN903_66 [Halorubrum sp. AJ67]